MAAIIAIAPSLPRIGGACLNLPPQPFVLAPIAGDTSPPRDFSVDVIIHRGNYGACNIGHGCPDSSYVMFDPVATDDHSMAHRIGYRLTLVDGVLPTAFEDRLPPEGATYVDQGIGVTFYFDEDLPPFRFVVAIVAIDESGNETAPIVVEVHGNTPRPYVWP